MRCLIVEDNEYVRVQARVFLMEHAEIELTADAREALDLFHEALAEARPFDLVLLDVLTPELDGPKTLTLMRQAEQESLIRPEKPSVIILTTSHESSRDIAEFYNEGEYTDYLTKPVIREDLMALLQRYQLI